MPKIQTVFLFFCALFIAIVIKLFYIQILNPISSAQNPYLQYRKIQPQRGKILDRNNQPFALNKTSYLLYAEPKKIKERYKVVEQLHEVLGMEESTVEARLDDSKDWVKIVAGVTKQQRDKLLKSRLGGIGFDDQFQRYYPEASLAAHLLGFVGKNKDGDDIGYFGVEGFYNQDLTGLPGFIKSERDIAGRTIFVGNQEKIEVENGRDLVLTIDKSVQDIAKQKLLKGLETYKAKEGCVLIADPYTMEMLAMSCLPDYDLEKYYNFSDQFFKNEAISSTYEPGSTFKPLVMAAAIEEKAVKPDDLYNEKGPVKIGEYQIRTWNNKYEGKISTTRILEKSSNVGMVHIGEKLGKKKLISYLKDYGFGSETGIDLQGETPSYLRDIWYPVDYATATFGQGIAVTPIQMIRAFSAVVNGGKLLVPHIVKKVTYDAKEKTVEPKVEKQVLSERTSEILRKMLVSTVEHGEYKWVRPAGYKIGGKTGTAEIAVGGRYGTPKTIASFVGFAPADRPRFIALVILKEPGTSIYGSETAAPLFFEIARELLYYYNISPQ